MATTTLSHVTSPLQRKRKHSSAVSPTCSLPTTSTASRSRLPTIATASTSQSTYPSSKRRKTELPSRDEIRTAFYDSLSQQWLTRTTLREGQRRFEKISHPCRPSSKDQLTSSSQHSTELKLYARHGGPDTQDLRGYPLYTSSSMATRSKTTPKSSKVPAKSVRSGRVEKSQSGSSKVTGVTKSSSAYAQDFEQHLIDVQIYPYDYFEEGSRKVQKAVNHDEVKLRLKKHQEIFSAAKFSEADFERVCDALDCPRSEVKFMDALLSVLQLDRAIPHEREQRFNNLEPLTEVLLTCAAPDFYDGASAARIHPDVRKKLSGVIQPSTRPELPFVPNFFLEVKRLLGGDGGVLARQALHNGALGARAMHELRSFGIPASDRPYGRADAITATFIQGYTLKIYSVHYGAPDAKTGISDKYMHFLVEHSLTASIESFLAGATAFRNAREWAKERRNEAIALANERASEMAKNRASAGGG